MATTERTFAFFGSGLIPGQQGTALVDGQTINLPSTLYQRTITQVVLESAVAPAAGPCAVQLLLAGVAQTGTYTLGEATKYGENTVAGQGLVVGPGLSPGVQLLAGNGVRNLTVWLVSTPSAPTSDEGEWIVFAEGDVQSTMSAPEWAQFTSGVVTGGTDPCPEIITRVTNHIRDAIRSGRKVPLGPDGMIPPSMLDPACDMSRYKLFCKYPALNRYAEFARPMYKDALDTVAEVKKGLTTPQAPDCPLQGEDQNVAASGGDDPIEV
jgi:hypothetical protein